MVYQKIKLSKINKNTYLLTCFFRYNKKMQKKDRL